jgi:hypothetical protein
MQKIRETRLVMNSAMVLVCLPASDLQTVLVQADPQVGPFGLAFLTGRLSLRK